MMGFIKGTVGNNMLLLINHYFDNMQITHFKKKQTQIGVKDSAREGIAHHNIL